MIVRMHSQKICIAVLWALYIGFSTACRTGIMTFLPASRVTARTSLPIAARMASTREAFSRRMPGRDSFTNSSSLALLEATLAMVERQQAEDRSATTLSRALEICCFTRSSSRPPGMVS